MLVRKGSAGATEEVRAEQSLSTFGDTALYLTLGIWAKSLTHSNAAAGSVFSPSASQRCSGR